MTSSTRTLGPLGARRPELTAWLATLHPRFDLLLDAGRASSAGRSAQALLSVGGVAWSVRSLGGLLPVRGGDGLRPRRRDHPRREGDGRGLTGSRARGAGASSHALARAAPLDDDAGDQDRDDRARRRGRPPRGPRPSGTRVPGTTQLELRIRRLAGVLVVRGPLVAEVLVADERPVRRAASAGRSRAAGCRAYRYSAIAIGTASWRRRTDW